MTVTVLKDFIDEIESALGSDSSDRSTDFVQRVTQLFLVNAAVYSSDQMALFDELLSRLAGKIESSAKAELALRMSRAPAVPPNLIRTLALDDAINVASPILKFSDHVDEATLVDCARRQSQGHLFAISRRRLVQEPVTDVLVERGEAAVLASIAINTGSRFSRNGYSMLVERAEGNDDLTAEIASRSDLPRELFLRLLTTASSHVRQKLEAQNPHHTKDIGKVVTQVTESISITTSDNAKNYTDALAHVGALHAAKNLGEADIQGFIARQEFERLIVALALLADIDIVTVEAAMLQKRTDRLLVICKAVSLGWPTVKPLLNYSVGERGLGTSDVEKARNDFERINPELAKRALTFRHRQKAE